LWGAQQLVFCFGDWFSGLCFHSAKGHIRFRGWIGCFRKPADDAFHFRNGMGEVLPKSATKIVQSRLAIRLSFVV